MADHLGPEGGLRQKSFSMAPNHENDLPRVVGRFGRFATTYGLRIRAPSLPQKEDQSMTKVDTGGTHIVQTDGLGRKLESFYVTGKLVYITATDDAIASGAEVNFILNEEDQTNLLALLLDARRKRDDAIANNVFEVPL